MGSVSSTNPGTAFLLQTLTDIDSPVMSNPTVVSALEKASPADTVQLSVEAVQAEAVSAMFGTAPSTNSLPTAASLENSSTAGATAPTDQLASYNAALQSQEVSGLLGENSVTGVPYSVLNVLG
jgi:hypothetical protein